jgi:hypothetical protein
MPFRPRSHVLRFAATPGGCHSDPDAEPDEGEGEESRPEALALAPDFTKRNCHRALQDKALKTKRNRARFLASLGMTCGRRGALTGTVWRQRVAGEGSPVSAPTPGGMSFRAERSAVRNLALSLWPLPLASQGDCHRALQDKAAQTTEQSEIPPFLLLARPGGGGVGMTCGRRDAPTSAKWRQRIVGRQAGLGGGADNFVTARLSVMLTLSERLDRTILELKVGRPAA